MNVKGGGKKMKKNLAKAQRNAKNCFFLSEPCDFARGKL